MWGARRVRAVGTTVFLTCVLMIGSAASASTASAATGQSLTLGLDMGPAGSSVHYTGSGFDDCSGATLTWDGRDETPGAGVEGNLTVPLDIAPGKHEVTLTLTCRIPVLNIAPVTETDTETETASAPFTVTVAEVTTDPTTPTSSGKNGNPVGRGTATPTAPSSPPTTPATTEQHAPATVRLSAYSAEPGDAVTATGRNFTEQCPPRRMSLLVNGEPVTPIGTSGDAGDPSVAFALPDLSAGLARVRLSCADGPTAVATLRVVDPSTSPTSTPPSRPGPDTPGPTPSQSGGVIPASGGNPPGPPGPFVLASAATSRSEFARSVPTPYELDWTLPAILTSLILAGFLFWAMGFPSEPFNKTLEEKREEVREWFATRRRQRGEHARKRDDLPPPSSDGEPRCESPRLLGGWVGLPLWCALAAVLLSLVEPSTPLAPSDWVPVPPLAVGFLIAVPVTTISYALPAEMYVRGAGGGGAALRFLPGAVLFAAACVALSRWVHLEPGYVYGLFAFYAASQHSGQRETTAGRGVLFGSLWLLAVSVAAWFAWPLVIPTASAADPGYWVLVADSALVAVFVLGTQTLVFGLIPLEFLDGHKLKSWKSPVWAVVWVCSLALFVHVLLGKFVKEVRNPAVAIVAASAFLVFGALSAGFWLAARWAPCGHAEVSDSGHDRHAGETGSPSPRLALGIAVGLLLVAVPVTVIVAGSIWAGSASAGVARYAATVSVDELRVRPEPSTGRPQVDVLPRGREVDVRCARTTPDDTWYQLLNPHLGSWVSDVGLSFPDSPRPPRC